MGDKALWHTALVPMDPEQSCRCEVQVPFQAGAPEQHRNVEEAPSARSFTCSWENTKPRCGLQLASG